MKADGYRAQIHKTGPRLRFLSSTGNDLTGRLQGLAHDLAAIPQRGAIIDAELVAADPATGGIDFYGLPAAMKWHPERLALLAFDLLALDGKDIRGLPLQKRFALLEDLVRRAGIAAFQIVHQQDDGVALFNDCVLHGFEGVVAKRIRSTCRSGRTTSWIKTKCPAWVEANRNRFARLTADPVSAA